MEKTVTSGGLYWQGCVADFRRQLVDWAAFTGSLKDFLQQQLH